MILRSLSTLLLCLSMVSLNAQSAREVFEGRKDIFLANNIYVIYTGSPVLDSALKESFSKYWTVRPIKGFITKDELKELIADKGNSFFYPTGYFYSVNRGSSHGDRSAAGIFAFNGGKKNTGRYNLLVESASVEYFDAFCGETNIEDAAYRLPLMVTDLQHDMNLKYDTTAKPAFAKDKILLINENSVKGKKRSESIRESALAAWPWKYELMSPEKIGTMIRERNTHYLLLTAVLSDAGAAVTVHDLASMKLLAVRGRSAIMGLPWVREKEMQALVDALSALKAKK